MKSRLVVSGLILLFAGSALAETVYYPPQVTGKRERKNIRHFLYVKNLSGDKRAVYDEYGYTTHRLRLNGYGEVREEWTYYDAGKVFVFDSCGNLVDTQAISPEQRRDWGYAHERACCRSDD
jgi:hypothetical protein